MQAPMAIPAVSQPPTTASMALIATQSEPQLSITQPWPMVPMDIQQLQQLSTSTANLNRHGQPIRKPA
uniref:Uncharacterized protein n=1 Tax=Romanomermis culicivorax TaxID=13658 RepID=A0A915L626_ROMCU